MGEMLILCNYSLVAERVLQIIDKKIYHLLTKEKKIAALDKKRKYSHLII